MADLNQPYIDYFLQVSQNPSHAEKEALLEKIKVNGANLDEMLEA